MGRAGATAMRHARAVIEAQWPDAPLLRARQALVRAKGKQFTVMEDVFGVFDFALLDHAGDFIGIQVTTEGVKRSSTADRKRKIRKWVEQHYGLQAQPFRFEIKLWAWVRGKHFREWKWAWDLADWVESQPVRSPLIRS